MNILALDFTIKKKIVNKLFRNSKNVVVNVTQPSNNPLHQSRFRAIAKSSEYQCSQVSYIRSAHIYLGVKLQQLQN